ncbi:MAG TPA: hypothetical protein VHY76_16330 [Acetobacteraceae bacterium]|nr:hypothetical protein [Acetobacteraceae bacterium]
MAARRPERATHRTAKWGQTVGTDWTSPISGAWSDGGLWSGAVPNAADAATIAAPGAYTVRIAAPAAAASLLLNDAGATLDVASTLASGGAVDIAAGTLDLAAGGTLAGGTLETTGGVVLANGGTLVGTQVRGPLDLDAAGAALTLLGSPDLVGATGTGAGTILLGGDAAALTLSGTQTIDATTIDIGGADETSMMLVTDPHGAGTTLTLGPATLIQQTGRYAAMFTSVTAGDAVDNLGTIAADVAGGRFGVSGGALVNDGLMSAAAGGTLAISFRHLENDGTIGVGAGALVELGAAGAAYAGSGALLVAGGTMALEGEVSLPEIAAVRQSGGVLLIDGSLGLAGGTLALPAGVAAGEWQLGGTIAQGTISDPGGLLGVAPGTNGAGGTLDDVTWLGTLALTGAGETLTVLDGLTILNAAGTAPGTIAVSGSGATLALSLSQTLDAATLNLGSDGEAAAALIGTDPFESTGMTVTLGAGLAVQQTGSLALIAAAATAGDALFNLGRIDAAFAGGTLTLGGAAFVNQGTIEIGAGQTAIAAAASFDNSGLVRVDAGGTFDLGIGDWSNEGSIVAAGGTVVLAGAIAASAPAAITEAGGVVDLAGTLALAGSTLAAGRGTGASYVLSGEIDGGTLSDGGFGVSYSASGGTLPLLDGVTVRGTLGLGGAGSALAIEGPFAITGLAGAGQGSIDLSGAGSTLEAIGNITIDIATLGIGSAAGSTLTTAGLAAPATLTLGAGLHVSQGSTIAELLAAGADTILNLGSIAAFVVHGSFAVAGNSFINAGAISVGNTDRLSITTAQFRNTGTIAASSNGVVAIGIAGATWSSTGTISETGGVLDLDGSFGLADIETVRRNAGVVDVLGTLSDAGGVLAIGAGSALGTLLLQGRIVGGTIEDGGGGLAFSGAGTLHGVTYQGMLDLSTAGATLALESGFVMSGPGGSAGTIDVLGAGDALQFRDSQALNGTTVVLGNASQAASLAFVDTQTGGETLRLGATTTVVQQSGSAEILGGAQAGDSIVNSGTIVAAVPGAALAVYGGSFDNLGTITVANAGTLVMQPQTLANLAAGTLAGGTWQVGAGSTLVLPDNAAVATDAATITLGAGAAIDWLSSATFQTIPLAATLGTIAAAGTLDLLVGASFAAGAFTDNGAIVLNGATFWAASLTLGTGGRISGTGEIASAVGGAGSIAASGGRLAIAGAVTGAEALQVAAGSTLALAGAVSAASSIGFEGPAATLLLSQPGAVAATIAGFAPGETIDLPGIAPSGTTASLQGSALVIGEGNGGALSLALAAGTSGTANAASDGAGGTRITLGSANLQISPMVFVATAAPPTTTAGSAAALDGSTIASLGFGDRIDVTNLSPTGAALSLLARGATEDITIASPGISTTLHLGGLYAASAFLLGADGHGGTMVTYAPPDA